MTETTDGLVERLRKVSGFTTLPAMYAIIQEAADRIVALQDEVERLRVIEGEQQGFVTGLDACNQSLKTALARVSKLDEENLHLRAALATSKDPCIYCQLPAEEMAKCRAGFPGCSRADDLSGCPEFGAMMNAHYLQERISKLEAGLRENAATMETQARRMNEWGKSHVELDEAISDTRSLLAPASLSREGEEETDLPADFPEEARLTIGRDPSGQALVASDQAPSGLARSGFDPSRKDETIEKLARAFADAEFQEEVWNHHVKLARVAWAICTGGVS